MATKHSVLSCAKINLGLYLIRKRPDGYHDIATLFQQIDLSDTLLFGHSESMRLTCSDPSIPTDDGNLILKAIQVYNEAAGLDDRYVVHLEKRIPAGGGLGGGSSNAAAALRTCRILGEKQLSNHKLHEIAIEIGSDVPFFLNGGTALGLGRGEVLEPVSLPMDYYVLLINPGIHISTAWAYSQAIIGLTNGEKIGKFRALLQKPCVDAWRGALNNDLESVVFQKYPELQTIKNQLYARGAFYASLSGSGATMYGLFHDRQVATGAQSFFEGRSGNKVFLCRPVSGQSLSLDNPAKEEEIA